MFPDSASCMCVKITGGFLNDQLHFWFNKDDMYLCKCFRVSLYHIPIFSMIVHFFLPSRRSKIWNKTVHSFHSLEENIGDICDDLQKMCFVVVFLKKILLKSWQIFNVLDWTDWQFKRSKANITLPKDQLKIVLCVCVLQAANVLAGKNCCYLAPAKKIFSNYSN